MTSNKVLNSGELISRYDKEKIMSLTTLDAHAALIVIDLQKGVVGLPIAHPAAEIVSRAAEDVPPRRPGCGPISANLLPHCPSSTHDLKVNLDPPPRECLPQST